MDENIISVPPIELFSCKNITTTAIVDQLLIEPLKGPSGSTHEIEMSGQYQVPPPSRYLEGNSSSCHPERTTSRH